MSKHSTAYEKQKSKLKAKEEDIRSALEKESDQAEEELFNYLKLIAITAGASLIGYGIYRLFRKDKKAEIKSSDFTSNLNKEARNKTQSKEGKGFSFRDNLKQSLSEQIVAAIMSYVSGYLTRMQQKSDDKRSKD